MDPIIGPSGVPKKGTDHRPKLGSNAFEVGAADCHLGLIRATKKNPIIMTAAIMAGRAAAPRIDPL